MIRPSGLVFYIIALIIPIFFTWLFAFTTFEELVAELMMNKPIDIVGKRLYYIIILSIMLFVGGIKQ